MDSVAYLKRQHELKGDPIVALIADEIITLRARVQELERNQCKCPDVPGFEQLG